MRTLIHPGLTTFITVSWLAVPACCLAQQLPGQVGIFTPPQSVTLPQGEAARVIESANENTTRTLVERLNQLLRGGENDVLSKPILEHMDRFPEDRAVIQTLIERLPANPKQDPARSVADALNSLYGDRSVPGDIRKRREKFLEHLQARLRRDLLTNITAKGTGRTTGAIAHVSVTNTAQSDIMIAPQAVYVPSNKPYQRYVARIPETVIPPGTSTIPVDGYCADVRMPPVPSGTDMPPVGDWIPVGDPDEIPEGFGLPLVTSLPVPRFTPEDIVDIPSSPGYKPVTTGTPGGITVTWPGTDVPVGGVFNPTADEETFARIVVEAVDRVESAFDELRGEGVINTPFSGDPPRERESVIQQTFWIFTAGLTGDDYTLEDFKGKVYDQYTGSSGRAISDLPEENKEELDAGIADFWNVFQATGVEAKLFTKPAGSSNPEDLLMSAKAKPYCECGPISATLSIQVQKKAGKNWEDDGPAKTLDLGASTTAILNHHPFSNTDHQLVASVVSIATPCHCISPDLKKAREDLAKATDPKGKVLKAIADAQVKLDKLIKDQEKARENRKAAFDEDIQVARDSLTAKKKVLEDIQTKAKDLESSKPDCPLFKDTKAKSPGYNLNVYRGDSTSDQVTPKDGTYTFSTKGLQFTVEVDYICQDDNCKQAECSKKYTVTFQK